MAIPLPRVVSDVGPGGALTSALEGSNALRISNAQAKYAPYNAYADAMSKLAYAQYAPYQIQAQVMSNPLMALAFKDHPEQFAAMMKNFTNSVPSQNGLANNLGIPVPGQSVGNRLLNMFIDKVSGGGGNALTQGMPEQGASTNPLSAPAGAPAASSNALNPGLGGTAAGAIGATTAPLVKSPFISAPTVPNQQGGLTQAPTAETIAGGQKASVAAERIKPILEDLSKEFKSFYTMKGVANIIGAGIGTVLNADEKTVKKFGVDPDAVSDFAQFQGTLKTAIIDSMGAYGIHQEAGMNEQIGDILRPRIGERTGGYQRRVDKQLQRIKHQQDINKGIITSGIEVNPEGQPEAVAAPAPAVSAPAVENKPISKGSKRLAKGLELPSFGSQKEAQDWFNAQPETVQNAIRLHLKPKGNK